MLALVAKDYRRSMAARDGYCEAMRILLVSQQYPPARIAGSELQVQLLASTLKGKAIESRVLTTRSCGDIYPEQGSVPVEVVNTLGFPVRRFSQWALTRHFLNSCDDVFDVVHCHCISPTSLAAIQVFRQRGVPILLQPSLGGKGGELDRARFFGVRGLINKVIRSADAYAVLNDDIGHDLVSLGIDKERLVMVRNGVDLHRFQPVAASRKRTLRQQLDLPSGEIVLFVGQFVVRKGIPELLQAWPSVVADAPSAHLVFVGAGPLASSIATACGQFESIHCLGERRDIHELMQAADVLAFPSRNESFGCVLIEAMACGLPVIAGNTGLAATLPIAGQAGRCIEPGDRAGLQHGLVELLSSPELRQQFGQCAHQLASAYDIHNVADDMLQIYRSLAT